MFALRFICVMLKPHNKRSLFVVLTGELNDITFTVKEDLMEGQTVVASCSVPHSCPTSPPDFTWSLPGKQHFQPRQLGDGQWTATSTLHFLPTRADHDKLLRCNVTYKGGQSQKAEKLLRVKRKFDFLLQELSIDFTF